MAAPPPPKIIIIQSKQDYNDIINLKPIAIIKFYALWCPYCTKIKQTFEQLATALPSITFAEVNIEENKDLTANNKVTSLPTFIVYANGELIDKIEGYDKERLNRAIQNVTPVQASKNNKTSKQIQREEMENQNNQMKQKYFEEPEQTIEDDVHSIHENTEEMEFYKLLGKGISIVNFYTEWCVPCKKIHPAYDALSLQFPNIKFIYADAEKYASISAMLGISAVPTFVIFDNRNVINTIVANFKALEAYVHSLYV